MSNGLPESRLRFSTILIAAGASLFFCSKGVFVKCAYRHGADYLTVLTLRMIFALPFFLITGLFAKRRRNILLTPREWAAMAGLGFLGYYVSSVLNFAGLAYTSVGLERIVLYSYPSLVVLGSAIFLKQPLQKSVMVAAGIAWLGIAVAFSGEAASRADGHGTVGLGTALVFGSAVTYAAFILLSGQLLKRIGPAVFTSGVVAFSALFVVVHFLTQRPAVSLLHQPAPVYGWCAVLASVSTVIPSYLMGMGIARAGAARFAVIGTSGPVMTVLLAWLMLGERVNAMQLLGFALSLGGGLAVSLLKPKTKPAAVPVVTET